jgi:hypothetical protein
MAKQVMHQFIFFLLPGSNSTFARDLFFEILTTEHLYSQFFADFHKILAEQSPAPLLFQVLPLVLEKDNSIDRLPYLIADVIMWIGIAFQFVMDPKLKVVEGYISDCLMIIYGRIATSVPETAPVNLYSFDELRTTINILAGQLYKVSTTLLQELCGRIDVLVTSVNQASVMIGGVFILYLISKLSSFVDSKSRDIMKTIIEKLVTAFNGARPGVVFRFSIIWMNLGIHPNLFSEGQLSVIFKAVVRSLAWNVKHDFGFTESVMLLRELMAVVPKSAIDDIVEVFLAAIRNVFFKMPVSEVHMKFVLCYLAVRTDLRDFLAPNQNLSLQTLICLAANPSPLFCRDAEVAVHKLEDSIKGDTLIHVLSKNIESQPLATLGMAIVNRLTPEMVNEKWVNMLRELRNVLSGIPEAQDFRDKFTDLVVTVATRSNRAVVEGVLKELFA